MKKNNNTNNKQKNGRQNVPRSQPKKRNNKHSEKRAEYNSERDKCVREFAHARVNPFGVSGLPCNPLYDSTDSVRIKSWARGTIHTTSGGIAFLAWDPRLGLRNDIGTGAASNNYFTNTSTAASGINIADPSTTDGHKILSSFESGGNGRYGLKCAGAGIKITCTSPALTAAGTVYTFFTQENRARATWTDNEISSNVLTKVDPIVPGQSYYNIWNTRNGQHDDSFFAHDPAQVATNGFYIKANDASSVQSFFYEIVGFYELISLTPAHTVIGTPSPNHFTDALPIVEGMAKATNKLQSATSGSWAIAIREIVPSYTALATHAVLAAANQYVGAQAAIARIP